MFRQGTNPWRRSKKRPFISRDRFWKRENRKIEIPCDAEIKHFPLLHLHLLAKLQLYPSICFQCSCKRPESRTRGSLFQSVQFLIQPTPTICLSVHLSYSWLSASLMCSFLPSFAISSTSVVTSPTKSLHRLLLCTSPSFPAKSNGADRANRISFAMDHIQHLNPQPLLHESFQPRKGEKWDFFSIEQK